MTNKTTKRELASLAATWVIVMIVLPLLANAALAFGPNWLSTDAVIWSTIITELWALAMAIMAISACVGCSESD